MKKLLVVMMAVMAITGLMVIPAFSADKLIVKDSTTPGNTVFVVQDTGITSIVSPIAGNLLEMQTTNAVGGAGFQFNVPTGGSWNFKATMDNGFKIRDAANARDAIFVQAVTGNVGIGSNAPATALYVPGTISYGALAQISSRSYKNNIEAIPADTATKMVEGLAPVSFTYLTDPDTKHLGFIAEDVPAQVATKDRKGVMVTEIVAVLTKVVQEQNRTIAELTEKLNLLEGKVSKINRNFSKGYLNFPRLSQRSQDALCSHP